MTAWKQDIYIEQGATFPLGFVLHEPTFDSQGEIVLDDDGAPVPGPARDLSGYSCRMQIRPNAKSKKVLLAATSATDDSDGAGRILIENNDVTGRIDIILTDLDTDGLNVATATYDVELVRPLEQGELRPFVERILQGVVTTDFNTTRDE